MSDRGKAQAIAKVQSICELMAAYDQACSSNSEVSYDGELLDSNALLDRIYELALSVQVRSTWQSLDEELRPSEYQIELCTGGPAVRIVGFLDPYNFPTTAPRVEYRDWGIVSEPLPLTLDQEKAIFRFVRMFFNG